MNEIKKHILYIFLLIFICILVGIGIREINEYFEYETMSKNSYAYKECMPLYDYPYMNNGTEFYCKEKLCNSYNLTMADSSTFVNPIVYCTSNMGGYIKVQMPSHSYDECDDYFWNMYEKERCFYENGWTQK